MDLPAWKKLEVLYEQKGERSFDLRGAFKTDPMRASRFRIELIFGEKDVGFYYDYSKNLIDEDIMKCLFELLEESGFQEYREAMYSGVKINATEARAVLHMALRGQPSAFYEQMFQETIREGKMRGVYDYAKEMPDIYHLVQGELSKVKVMSEQVRCGEWVGYTGKKITKIVNIGIGGSDLGPRMVYMALKGCSDVAELPCEYVSNVDAMDLALVLKDCDVETTLFIIVSKTFTTQETMMNANSARQWFLSKSGGMVRSSCSLIASFYCVFNRRNI